MNEYLEQFDNATIVANTSSSNQTVSSNAEPETCNHEAPRSGAVRLQRGCEWEESDSPICTQDPVYHIESEDKVVCLKHYQTWQGDVTAFTWEVMETLYVHRNELSPYLEGKGIVKLIQQLGVVG